jgi:hypothetical protein
MARISSTGRRIVNCSVAMQRVSTLFKKKINKTIDELFIVVYSCYEASPCQGRGSLEDSQEGI